MLELKPLSREAIDRALAKVKPDIVFACYGMNDGIYYPFSEERFAAYQDGVGRLIEKVKATGAKLVLMTPPAFDPLPLKQKGKLLPAGADKYAWFSIYEGYDDVLKRYSQWLMQQGDRVDLVIDLHTPVNAYVAEKRKADANFTMSPDGVHVNHEGHREQHGQLSVEVQPAADGQRRQRRGDPLRPGRARPARRAAGLG